MGRLPRTRGCVLRELAELIAQGSDLTRELADLLEANDDAETYASDRLPAELERLKDGRRVYREWCASGRVDGVRREGQIWTCSRAAWHAARSKPARSGHVAPPAAANDASDEAIAARALDGWRASRRTG